MFKFFKKGKMPEKKVYPFDVEKAYYYRRSGLMAGANCSIEIKPEGVIEHYSYPIPVPEMECGMRDRGADVYFVGIKPGVVQVDIVTHYPTCPEEEKSLTLQVAEDGTVTKVE